MHCAKTGVLWTPYELDFDPADRTVQPNKNYLTYQNDGPVSGGPWSTFSKTGYLFQMFMLRIQDYGPSGAPTDEERLRVRCRLGQLNVGQRYGTSARGRLHVACSGTHGTLGWIVGGEPKLDVTQIGTDVVICSYMTPFSANGTSVSQTVEILDNTGTLIPGNTVTRVTEADLPGDISPDGVANWTGGNYYGAAWFVFKNGFPPTLSTSIQTMARRWKSGARDICPLLAGVE